MGEGHVLELSPGNTQTCCSYGQAGGRCKEQMKTEDSTVGVIVAETRILTLDMVAIKLKES